MEFVDIDHTKMPKLTIKDVGEVMAYVDATNQGDCTVIVSPGLCAMKFDHITVGLTEELFNCTEEELCTAVMKELQKSADKYKDTLHEAS